MLSPLNNLWKMRKKINLCGQSWRKKTKNIIHKRKNCSDMVASRSEKRTKYCWFDEFLIFNIIFLRVCSTKSIVSHITPIKNIFLLHQTPMEHVIWMMLLKLKYLCFCRGDSTSYNILSRKVGLFFFKLLNFSFFSLQFQHFINKISFWSPLCQNYWISNILPLRYTMQTYVLKKILIILQNENFFPIFIRNVYWYW